MAVQFKPKPGKPHIILYESPFNFYMWPIESDISDAEEMAMNYCRRVNPKFYKTAGEAARALHYGSANK